MVDTTDTMARLVAIKERAAKATVGPWTTIDGGQILSGKGRWLLTDSFETDGAFQYAEDADFSANAREDVPWLIAYAEQIQRERDELRKVVDALAKTRDGATITPGMKVYRMYCGVVREYVVARGSVAVYRQRFGGPAGELRVYDPYRMARDIGDAETCYSTRSAATPTTTTALSAHPPPTAPTPACRATCR